MNDHDTVITPGIDFVRVVRCKDCKYYEPDKYDPGNGDCLGACDNLVKVSDEWFCPKGVKKE